MYLVEARFPSFVFVSGILSDENGEIRRVPVRSQSLTFSEKEEYKESWLMLRKIFCS